MIFPLRQLLAKAHECVGKPHKDKGRNIWRRQSNISVMSLKRTALWLISTPNVFFNWSFTTA